MVVPPRPWQNVMSGGYVRLKVPIVRPSNGSEMQLACADKAHFPRLRHALDTLSGQSWRINAEVYLVMKKIWAAGGKFGDLPPREDLALPNVSEFDMTNVDSVAKYRRACKRVEQRNRELNSLRCDVIYKLQVAEEFLHEDAIYFPYNLDFRGRAYPIPPNLNHLGADLCRSLLIFRDPKPLGQSGLRYVYGVFISFRVCFSNEESLWTLSKIYILDIYYIHIIQYYECNNTTICLIFNI